MFCIPIIFYTKNININKGYDKRIKILNIQDFTILYANVTIEEFGYMFSIYILVQSNNKK